MKPYKVRDVMTFGVVCVTVDMSVKDVARTLATAGVGGAPVLNNNGTVVGVVSEIDLLHEETRRRIRGPVIPFVHRRQRTRSSGRVAGDLLTTSAVTVHENASVVEAARLLVQHQIRRVPVIDTAGQLVGIVSSHDLLKVLLRADADLKEEIART